MGKHPRWFWIFNILFLLLLLLATFITPIRHTIAQWAVTLWLFVKEHTIALVSGFFLVKGKFVFKLFFQKIVLLSVTGLSKRYLIEKVFTYHLKVHFFNHIAKDIARLFTHIKKNFMHFPLTKKLLALFALLGSLSYIGKFMGTILAIKVFLAKVWSFLLAIVLKVGSAIAYFLTEYLWGSWLGPLFEVIVFSWLLSWLEKIPFLTGTIRWLYRQFLYIGKGIDWVLATLFHIPLRKILRWMVAKIRQTIYHFIGYKRISSYFQLQELHRYRISNYQKLRAKRGAYYTKLHSQRLSSYHRYRTKRETRGILKKTSFYHTHFKKEVTHAPYAY